MLRDNLEPCLPGVVGKESDAEASAAAQIATKNADGLPRRQGGKSFMFGLREAIGVAVLAAILLFW